MIHARFCNHIRINRFQVNFGLTLVDDLRERFFFVHLSCPGAAAVALGLSLSDSITVIKAGLDEINDTSLVLIKAESERSIVQLLSLCD